MADTLYSNGPYNGTLNAWEINFGFSVSDSFTCGGVNGCGVEDFHMVGWNENISDILQTVEMQVGSTSFGSNYTEQVLTVGGSTDLGPNQYGYELWQYDFSFNNVVAVPNGTSWVTLSNAVTSQGQPFYWDENDGPSSAYANSVGSIGSESFTVTACPCCGVRGPNCGPPVPEPSSILLFGSGILGIVGLLRRKMNR